LESLLEPINSDLPATASANQRLIQFLQGCGERSILFFSNSMARAQEIAILAGLAQPR
jgi:hypothetical protein